MTVKLTPNSSGGYNCQLYGKDGKPIGPPATFTTYPDAEAGKTLTELAISTLGG